jgi:hypothetical protein
MSIYELYLSRPIVDRNNGSYADWCNLRVTFDIPTGLTFASIKLSFPSTRFWSLNKTMDMSHVKGKLSQLDAEDHVLKESDFDVTNTSPFTDIPESGVSKVRVDINEIDYVVNNSAGIMYSDIYSEVNFTLLIIDLLNDEGNSLLSVRLIAKWLVFTFRTPQSVNISDVTPTYVIDVHGLNTMDVIGGWGFRITNVSGSADESDTVTIETLSNVDTVIETKTIPVAIGNYAIVSQSSSVYKLRVKLNTSKHLVINGDVLEVGKWL